MAGLFSSPFLKLGAALSAREQVQTMISSNIANSDTPNYRADKRTFSDFLAQKTREHASPNLSLTHARHLDSSHEAGLSLSVFRRSTEEQRMDGNTVDLQLEMANLSENQLMHELNMKILQSRLAGISNAIKEGGR
ncbi:MAG: flagellar basal body rod protein FlgB [Mariprofundaceae bacterium]|nr:flagellar basal body rod protein FlgB [Mariprofundaceae bacterium]